MQPMEGKMKKEVKVLIYTVMVISLIACSFVGFRRIQTEENYKQVEIAIRYNDVLRIAMETDRSLEEVLFKFKELGVTTLFVRENAVASPIESDLYTYKGLGKVSLLEGYILRFYYPDVKDVKPEYRYMVTDDKTVAENIYESYRTKGIDLEYVEQDGIYFICIGEHGNELTNTGVGFDTDALNIAANLGYTISPQIKSWTNITPESIDYLVQELEGIKGIDTLYFADADIPGANDESMEAFINNHQLGFIEFTSNKQKGFNTLAKNTSEEGKHYKVIRLHTVGDTQIIDFTVPQLMERYELALRERNLRAFLFKMPTTVNIEEDITYLQDAISSFAEYATSKGYTLTGTVEDYNLPPIPVFVAILVGLAAIMIFILLLAELNLTKLGYIIGIIGIIGYIGLLKLRPTLASQLMALFGSIVFPTYAMIKGLREKPRNVKETILSFLKICIISFGGVLTIIGTLSRTNFALALDVFAGVKVATVAPIVLIVVFLIYQKHKLDLKYYKGILDKKISYGALLLIAILGGVLVIYITRTGNSGTASGLERQFRQFLDNVLGVRPRTKEFLIAYPILMCLLYYGYKETYLPMVILAIIGPVSLVNTYAHIHTPILISLLRSAYGIILGIVIGLVLIWGIKLLRRMMKKWQTQTK